jgi:E3 ubiquitin-protein ligase SHPRH
MDEMKGRVKTDTLQRLHAVTNLAELLEAKHEGIDPTLRDHTLRQEAEELKQHYLSKYNTAVLAAKVGMALVHN